MHAGLVPPRVLLSKGYVYIYIYIYNRGSGFRPLVAVAPRPKERALDIPGFSPSRCTPQPGGPSSFQGLALPPWGGLLGPCMGDLRSLISNVGETCIHFGLFAPQALEV